VAVERRYAIAVVDLFGYTGASFGWDSVEPIPHNLALLACVSIRKGHIPVDDSIGTSSTREAVATLAKLLNLPRFNRTVFPIE